ncbi:cytochrome P450 [Rhodocollybia butyracea]|uniref:Cytochrome P450 n=1 Tax=Rhodocollybia butyracea TaxID=206335 RepID=A0A9P5U7Y9_9AGAR|nr:cytochrome P450 [Rhodocollybia butyracea]
MAPASPLFATLYGIAALAIALLYFLPRRQSFVESLPPGPQSPSMPTLDAWVQYQQWGKEYGELVYIRKHNMLIINNAHVAIDLLEKCACLYSDRPMTQVMKLCEADKILSIQKTGSGTSLIAELALENEGKPAEIKKIKAMGTVSFMAGADTIMSAMSSFLLTMVQNSDVQSKARAEIDRVIGRDRLPMFEDRRSLPYVESIYRKIMRMHPALPLGLFHVSTEDDFYRVTIFLKVDVRSSPMSGEIMPGSLQVEARELKDIPRAMNRDPNVYSEPDTFKPERFLDSPNRPFTSINNILAFGFGRRVCVGRYMADNTTWLAIASVLATLDLQKAKDSEGNEVDISGEYTRTFFRHPKPYQCSITPRDLQARDSILATATAD